MPKIKFRSADDSDDSDLDREEVAPKWFDIFKNEPISFETSSDHTVTAHKIEAQKVFEDQEKIYQLKISKAPKNSDEGWLRTVLQKGTTGDKVAALILSVQKSPVNNFNALSILISMVKVSKKKHCLSVLDNLCELLVDELLPTGKKLRSWPNHPFKHLSTVTNGHDRSRLLAAWLYESKLKEAYTELISSLEVIAKDTVDTYREKAISAMYKLLSSHPEQEEVLLRSIVNKLGDPVQKVVSKVIYCLTQLLRIHPNMKMVVMNEVEKLLFRPNIGVRTQYYAICFLSQFIFSNEDQEVARYLIKIYFSFFKASIKKGDVDSRLMGALLMGVKRAYPFAKLDVASLNEHVTTLYKLVHISPFNISLHTLCLLEQVSLHCEDRFYNALYKKLLDPKLINTSLQAMFINLMYKALSKDENILRVIAIIKRLFQVCLHMPVCFLCGTLYMVSQLMKNKSILIVESKAIQFSQFDEDTSEDEVYYDADKENVTVETEMKEKKVTGWNFVEYNSKSSKNKSCDYDWNTRNPAYANADSSAYFELLHLCNHFHPTVSLFASKILNGEVIVYNGDPLADFSLIRFLERFSFKNPKSNANTENDVTKGPDPKLAPRKYYKPSGMKAVNVNSKTYMNQEARFVPVDEVFLYRYIKEKNVNVNSRKTESDADDFDDNVSVASDEFEELLNSMMGKKAADRDYMSDVGDKLQKGKKSGQEQEEIDDESSSGESGSEEVADEMSSDEGDSGSDDGEEEMPSDIDDIGSDDNEEMEFSEGSGPDEDIDIDDFLNQSSKSKTKSKKIPLKKKIKKSDGLDGLFAPAEEFSELLEETGSSKTKSGMFNTLANPENAAEKQLNWEVKRDRWVRGANDRKRKFNKPGGKFRKKFKH